MGCTSHMCLVLCAPCMSGNKKESSYSLNHLTAVTGGRAPREALILKHWHRQAQHELSRIVFLLVSADAFDASGTHEADRCAISHRETTARQKVRRERSGSVWTNRSHDGCHRKESVICHTTGVSSFYADLCSVQLDNTQFFAGQIKHWCFDVLQNERKPDVPFLPEPGLRCSSLRAKGVSL